MAGLFAGISVSTILTPAIVSSVVTLLYNAQAEKKRAVRDYVSKVYDSARDDVRRAIEAAVEYYPLVAKERLPLKEAKVLMGERDVRHSITALIDFADGAGDGRSMLQDALDDFVNDLTGGSFQSAAAEADLDQVRKVALTGAKLRAAVSTARQHELIAAVTSGFLYRHTLPLQHWLGTQRGIAPGWEARGELGGK